MVVNLAPGEIEVEPADGEAGLCGEYLELEMRIRLRIEIGPKAHARGAVGAVAQVLRLAVGDQVRIAPRPGKLEAQIGAAAQFGIERGEIGTVEASAQIEGRQRLAGGEQARVAQMQFQVLERKLRKVVLALGGQAQRPTAQGGALEPGFEADRVACAALDGARRDPAIEASGPAWREDAGVQRAEREIQVGTRLRRPGDVARALHTAAGRPQREVVEARRSALGLAGGTPRESLPAQLRAFQGQLERPVRRRFPGHTVYAQAAVERAVPVSRPQRGIESCELRLQLGAEARRPPQAPPSVHAARAGLELQGIERGGAGVATTAGGEFHFHALQPCLAFDRVAVVVEAALELRPSITAA